MNTQSIIHEIDQDIIKLTTARAILLNLESPGRKLPPKPIKMPTKKKRGPYKKRATQT
jgi:hypothetical protein